MKLVCVTGSSPFYRRQRPPSCVCGCRQSGGGEGQEGQGREHQGQAQVALGPPSHPRYIFIKNLDETSQSRSNGECLWGHETTSCPSTVTLTLVAPSTVREVKERARWGRSTSTWSEYLVYVSKILWDICQILVFSQRRNEGRECKIGWQKRRRQLNCDNGWILSLSWAPLQHWPPLWWPAMRTQGRSTMKGGGDQPGQVDHGQYKSGITPMLSFVIDFIIHHQFVGKPGELSNWWGGQRRGREGPLGGDRTTEQDSESKQWSP